MNFGHTVLPPTQMVIHTFYILPDFKTFYHNVAYE